MELIHSCVACSYLQLSPGESALQYRHRLQVHFQEVVAEIGKQIADEIRRPNSAHKVVAESDLLEFDFPGCYWISTTMPLLELKKIGKLKARRKRSLPGPSKFIEQSDTAAYIIYNGTRANVGVRLAQHLFDKGGEKTGKLGFKINELPYSRYDWYVHAVELTDSLTRNAIECWWRHNIGWPVFCRRA